MGRPEFENQTSIAATTSKKISCRTQESIVSLPPSTYERITLFAPKNTVSKILNVFMSFAAIPGQTTGVRQVVVDNYISESQGIGIFSATGDAGYAYWFGFDQGIFKYANGITAGIVSTPGEQSVNANLRNFFFDEVIGVSFLFRHTHTAATTAARKIVVFTQEEQVKR